MKTKHVMLLPANLGLAVLYWDRTTQDFEEYTPDLEHDESDLRNAELVRMRKHYDGVVKMLESTITEVC